MNNIYKYTKLMASNATFLKLLSATTRNEDTIDKNLKQKIFRPRSVFKMKKKIGKNGILDINFEIKLIPFQNISCQIMSLIEFLVYFLFFKL